MLNLPFGPHKVFGHDSFDPDLGHTKENVHETFHKTLQGEALPSLIESMMGHLQDVLLKSDTLSQSKNRWEVDGIFAFCYKVSELCLKRRWEEFPRKIEKDWSGPRRCISLDFEVVDGRRLRSDRLYSPGNV